MVDDASKMAQLLSESEIRIKVREALQKLDTQLNDCDVETILLTMDDIHKELSEWLYNERVESLIQEEAARTKASNVSEVRSTDEHRT
mgnify:CR=1 FL=1